VSKLAANATLVVALLQAILLLLVAFGVNVTSDQKEAVIGVTTALLAIVGVYFHPSIPVGKVDPPPTAP
jgi:uncharacterized membrane protein